MGKRLWQWVCAIARWILEARRGWGSIALVVAIVFTAMSVAKTLDDGIRFAGMILQILGVVTVAIGLRDKRQTFERPGLIQIFRAWVSRFPRYAPKPHVISVQGIASASAVGSAYQAAEIPGATRKNWGRIPIYGAAGKWGNNWNLTPIFPTESSRAPKNDDQNRCHC